MVVPSALEVPLPTRGASGERVASWPLLVLFPAGLREVLLPALPPVPVPLPLEAELQPLDLLEELPRVAVAQVQLEQQEVPPASWDLELPGS